MRISVFLAILLLCVSSCSGGNDQSKSGEKESIIRITNGSPSVLDTVLVRFPEGVERFPNLAPGDTSEYHSVSTKQFDPRVSVYFAGEGDRAIPILSHYSGPAILDSGRYTCRVWIERVDGFGDDSFKVLHEFVRESDA